eukprot:746336-Hanusia_phi.AAC.1
MQAIKASEERAKVIARASKLLDDSEEAMRGGRLEEAKKMAEEARDLFRMAKVKDGLEEAEEMLEKIAKLRGEEEARERSRGLLQEGEEELKQRRFLKARELVEAAKRMMSVEDAEQQQEAGRLLARIGEEEQRHETRQRGEEALAKIDMFLQQEASKEARKVLDEARHLLSLAGCLQSFSAALELAEIRISRKEEEQERRMRVLGMMEEVEEAIGREEWEGATQQLQDAAASCRASSLMEELGERIEKLGEAIKEGREEERRVEEARRAIRACEEALEGLNMEAGRIFLGHAKEAVAACRSTRIKEELEELEKRIMSKEAANVLRGRAEEAISSVRANLELMRVAGKRNKVQDARASLESAKKLLVCSEEDHSAKLEELEREVGDGEKWALLCDEGEELLEEGRRLLQEEEVEEAGKKLEAAIKKFDEAGEDRSMRAARDVQAEVDRRRSAVRGAELLEAMRRRMEERQYGQVCEMSKLAEVEFMRAGMGDKVVEVEKMFQEASGLLTRHENAEKGETFLEDARQAVARGEMRQAKSLLVDAKAFFRFADRRDRLEEISKIEEELEEIETRQLANEQVDMALKDAHRLISEKDFRYARIVLSKAEEAAARADEHYKQQIVRCRTHLNDEERRWERWQEGEEKLRQAQHAYKQEEFDAALKHLDRADECYKEADDEEKKEILIQLRNDILASLQEHKTTEEISGLINRSEELLSAAKLRDAAELAREALTKIKGEANPNLKKRAERVIEMVEVKLKQSDLKEMFLQAINRGTVKQDKQKLSEREVRQSEDCNR